MECSPWLENKELGRVEFLPFLSCAGAGTCPPLGGAYRPGSRTQQGPFDFRGICLHIKANMSKQGLPIAHVDLKIFAMNF